MSSCGKTERRVADLLFEHGGPTSLFLPGEFPDDFVSGWELNGMDEARLRSKLPPRLCAILDTPQLPQSSALWERMHNGKVSEKYDNLVFVSSSKAHHVLYPQHRFSRCFFYDTGQRNPRDELNQRAVQHGRVHEDACIRFWCGRERRLYIATGLIQDADEPFLVDSSDFVSWDPYAPDGDVSLGEAKVCLSRTREGPLPERVHAQSGAASRPGTRPAAARSAREKHRAPPLSRTTNYPRSPRAEKPAAPA